MKKLTMLLSLLYLTAALAVPASALEYNISAPGDPEYGKPTSVEPVATADRGELSNVDVSKNAALVPPAFGSPTAYTLNSADPQFGPWLYAGRWCRYQWQRRHHRRSA